ncbi:MAG: hypothetical protein SynsKO_00200 [Synoicihabitans sp.]
MNYPTSLRRLGFTLAIATLAPAALTAESQPRSVNSQAAPARDFRLFVGLDIQALWNEEFATVTDYVNNRARLDAPDRPALPTSRLEGVRFQHTTKLSRNIISLDEIETEFAHGTQQDVGAWMRQQVAIQTATADQTDLISATVGRAQLAATTTNTGTSSTVNSSGRREAGTTGTSESSASNPTMNQLTRDLNNLQDQNTALDETGAFDDEVYGLESSTHDALIITAKISSPTPVADAYLVGLARIRTEEKKSQDVIFFRDIGNLDSSPKDLRIRKNDMPPGFKLLDLDLHIFREGQEIPSDKSEKQFALTRDETLEYLTLDRVSSNRGKTLPPTPVWSLAPAPLLATEGPRRFDFPITVHVDAKGRVTEFDESVIVPEQIAELARDLPFMPALKDGVPVSGIARINLSDFYQ